MVRKPDASERPALLHRPKGTVAKVMLARVSRRCDTQMVQRGRCYNRRYSRFDSAHELPMLGALRPMRRVTAVIDGQRPRIDPKRARNERPPLVGMVQDPS